MRRKRAFESSVEPTLSTNLLQIFYLNFEKVTDEDIVLRVKKEIKQRKTMILLS